MRQCNRHVLLKSLKIYLSSRFARKITNADKLLRSYMLVVRMHITPLIDCPKSVHFKYDDKNCMHNWVAT